MDVMWISGLLCTASDTAFEMQIPPDLARLLILNVKLDLKIFNDKGENIYAESRHPFGLGIDAYHSGLKYMIKRCPFGSKYKK